jgi:glutathione S-transferase
MRDTVAPHANIPVVEVDGRVAMAGHAIAVNECGVSCEIHVLNLGQGDQKAADYLKVNPTARIPTLIDPGGPGGKPLTVTQS